MDEYYEYLESKLKDEFMRESRKQKVCKGKIRRLQQIKKSNQNLIKKYSNRR